MNCKIFLACDWVDYQLDVAAYGEIQKVIEMIPKSPKLIKKVYFALRENIDKMDKEFIEWFHNTTEQYDLTIYDALFDAITSHGSTSEISESTAQVGFF